MMSGVAAIRVPCGLKAHQAVVREHARFDLDGLARRLFRRRLLLREAAQEAEREPDGHGPRRPPPGEQRHGQKGPPEGNAPEVGARQKRRGRRQQRPFDLPPPPTPTHTDC